MCDTCDDSRFELIEKYKKKLLDATNIGDSPEEMAVIDNILFRFWQMGWLNLATDTISRATAIETVRKAKSIGQAHRMLEQLPSAQTERDIPKKPISTTDRAWGIPLRQAVCPNCNVYLGMIHYVRGQPVGLPRSTGGNFH